MKINPKKPKGTYATKTENDGVACSIQNPDNSVGKREEKGEGPPPLTDGESSEDEDDELNPNSQPDTETKCRSYSFNVEMPKQIEESNQVFINRESGEILIHPRDETRNEEEWIQKSVIAGTK